MFTLGFTPALNKEGYAKMTFLGVEFKEGYKLIKDDEGKPVYEETGDVKINHWSMIHFHFEVMGQVRGINQKLAVTTGEAYTPDNNLGKLLINMGYGSKKLQLATDEDGFQTVDIEEDEEGFSESNEGFRSDILQFIESCEGKEFIAKLFKPQEGKQKGYWQIHINTVKPYVRKKSK